MRFRVIAVVGIAALAYLAFKDRAAFSLPSSTSFIIYLRNQISPFRLTLRTDPLDASCGRPIKLKVQATDSGGDPTDGLTVEADVAIPGLASGAKHVKLHRTGSGTYEGEVELESAGNWDVDLIATRDGRRGRQTFSIMVGAPTPDSGTRDDEDDDDS